jgi:hypothetical protein
MGSGYAVVAAVPLVATLGAACVAAIFVARRGDEAASRIARRAIGIQLTAVALSVALALYDLGFHHSVWVASGNVHDLILVLWISAVVAGGVVVAASVSRRHLDEHFPALPLLALFLPYVGLWMAGHWRL